MQRLSPRFPALAAGIASALLAGFLDGLAFTSMGGWFASLAGANTVRLGAALGAMSLADARLAGALLLAFVAGVVAAAVLARRLAPRRRAAAMGCATALVALAALAPAITFATIPSLLLLAAAMGAENGVAGSDDGPPLGVSGFTAAVAHFGRGLAAALMGEGGRGAWAPHGLLWLAFAVGAVSGARTCLAFGMGALWIAVAVAALLTVLVTGEEQPA